MRRALLAVSLALLALPAPAHAASCGPTNVPGGDWPVYGRDLANSRHQASEKLISPADAAFLTPAWTFSTKRAGGDGDVTGTPIIADGCAYIATTRGWLFALNADDGATVWKAKVPYGGSVNGSPAVADRKCGSKKVRRRVRRKGKRRTIVVRVAKLCPAVFVLVSRTQQAEGCPAGDPCKGPYAAAFDRRTGKLAWATPALDTQGGSDMFGSAVVFERTLIGGVSGGAAELGDEADRHAFQGAMLFLDTGKGKLLRKTWTIHPPEQPDDLYAGAGIWSTPAIDTARKVAYAGTANPFRPQVEHAHANAVLKFDVDRRSKRFGEILGSYKGNIDEYLPAFSELPCYDIPSNPPPFYPQGIGECGDIDMDFGASPNLLRGANGRLLVGNGQKSGVYHVFDAETMKPAFSQVVGIPTQFGGIVGSTAYDGHAVFGPVTIPGWVWSINARSGALRWIGPILDGLHWGPPVAVANGVVYSVDFTGFLNAFDARNGLPLAKRPLALGGGGSPLRVSWGGVAVARNRVYAAVGLTGLPDGFVIAYEPGGPQDLVDDLQETLSELAGSGGGGGGGGVTSASIVAGPGASYASYATPIVFTRVGGPLSFVNLDAVNHDVVAQDRGPDGRPLFRTNLIGLGQSAPVEGLDRTQAGRSYGFFCSIHPSMKGTVVVR